VIRGQVLASALVATSACQARCGAQEIDPALEVATVRDRYLAQPGFRRSVLEASLTNHDNTYSRDRLSRYGLASGGWEALPVWNPRTVPLSNAHVAALRRGESLALGEPATIWDEETPTTEAAWAELGARVFSEWPLRSDEFLEHALLDDAFARKNGLRPAADGSWPGLVAFRDVDGRARVGFTCALCHTTVDDAGVAVAGAARRDLDYGTIRLAYYDATGAPLERELGERMRRWGPGRADITGDDDEDPVAIPDLWQLHALENFTQAGTLRTEAHAAPALAVLAIRQETQMIQANRERIRPPRELAWALATYVADLRPAVRTDTEEPLAAAGRELFEEHCTGCHSGTTGSGPLVTAERVGTDRALADSEARGTGMFRPPSLVAVRDAAPYFHDGSVPTLADVLDPARLRPDYTRGVRGSGAIKGHAFGTQLPAEDRAALVAYLASW
jgi:mono/diheme cytochrome c family protein